MGTTFWVCLGFFGLIGFMGFVGFRAPPRE